MAGPVDNISAEWMVRDDDLMMLAALLILTGLGIGFLAASAASIVTGVSYWRPNLVRRREAPFTFWFSVATHAAIGAFAFAMIASMIAR